MRHQHAAVESAGGGTTEGMRSPAQHAWSEALTMSLYVSLVLAAELVVLSQTLSDKREAVAALWGAAVGLTAAHIFAFQLANRAVGGGRLSVHDWGAIWLQLAAAVCVAGALTVPFIVLEKSSAITVAEYMTAGFIGTLSYVTARTAGSHQLRALLFGAAMLAIAVAVVLFKAALTTH